MNLIEGTQILNCSANELITRLSTCLSSLHGPVPESPTNGQNKIMSSGLSGDLESCAVKIHEALRLVNELESLTSQHQNVANSAPKGIGLGAPMVGRY